MKTSEKENSPVESASKIPHSHETTHDKVSNAFSGSAILNINHK
jgi:hypothetical protein